MVERLTDLCLGVTEMRLMQKGLLLAGLALVGFVFADIRAADEKKEKPKDQPPARERPRGQQPRGQFGQGMGQLVPSELAEKLKLSGEQKDKIAKLQKDFEDKTKSATDK